MSIEERNDFTTKLLSINSVSKIFIVDCRR